MISLHSEFACPGWATYAAAGVLQGILLLMCLAYKARQARLGIDDYGNPLPEEEDTAVAANGSNLPSDNIGDETTPLLRT